MASNGTDFEIDIPVNGAGVEPAAAAVARLADRLTAASSAAAQAAEAVKAGESAYKQAEASASRAALAVEKIGLAAEAQRGKMAAALAVGDERAFWRAAAGAEKLAQRQAEATAKANQAKSAMTAAAASLDTLRSSSDAAAAAESNLSKGFEKASKSAKQAAEAAAGSGKVNEMAEAMGKLGGPLGSVGAKAFGAADGFKKLMGSMGSMGAYVAVALGVVAIVAALAAVAVAAVGAVAAVTQYGIATSDAARSSGLLADGIAGSVAGGRQLEATIHKLGAEVPQTREELMSMASDLAKTGLKGDALSSALEEAAVKAAKLKWGPDFAKQAVSMSNLTTRLKSNIAGVFGGLKLDGFLGALSKIVALFDSTSASGQAIKVVFESLFQPIIDALADLAPKIVSTFIQFEIWAMRALIAIKPWGSTLKAVGIGLAVLAGIIAAVVIVPIAMLVVTITEVVVIIGAMIAAGLYLTDMLFNLGKSIGAGVVPGLDWMVEKFREVMAFLSGISLAEVGMQIVQGLADGITNAGASVLAAITGVVGGAVDAAKGLLGIASPSRVFAEIGRNTAAGMAGGVDDEASTVQGSMEAMVAPPATGPAAAGGAASASGPGGGYTFEININAAGAAAEDIATAVRNAIQDLLDGDVAQLGAAVPT